MASGGETIGSSATVEFGNAPLGRLVTGVVIEAGLVGQFRSDADDGCGIIGDAAVIERQAGGMAEGGTTMVGGVLCGVHENGREGMNPPQLILGDHHEEGEDCLPDQKEIIIRWLPLKGGEGIVHLFEEERDGVWRHFYNF